MRSLFTVRRGAARNTIRALAALGAAGGLVLGLGVTAATPVASAGPSPNTPFTLPVTALPAVASSPTWCDGPAFQGAFGGPSGTATSGCTSSNPQVSDDPSVPYTPVVVSLIAQLEGGGSSGPASANPTVAELDNAANLDSRAGGSPSTCHNVGPTAAPKSPTPDGTTLTPAIQNICWTDAQGVNVTGGLNVRNDTGPTTLMALGATFDPTLGNAWGQVAGIEARELMVTGIYGPQTDIDVLPNWGRNLTTTGADPFLSQTLVDAQINGIQGWGSNYPGVGDGVISQMKHFMGYYGTSGSANNEIQDQAVHELLAAPYEAGALQARSGSIMCSYQQFQDLGAPAITVNSVQPELGNFNGVTTSAGAYAGVGFNYSTQIPSGQNASRNQSPFGTGNGYQTWPINLEHYSCDQPLSLTYIAHDLWDWPGEFASDYDATESSQDATEGTSQEESGTSHLSDQIGSLGTDPLSSDTCVNPWAYVPGTTILGEQVPCVVGPNEPFSVRVAGIPIPNGGTECWGSSPTGDNTPTQATAANTTDGCALVGAVYNGSLPISVFDQGLAQNLYEMQRFGQLGCPDGSGAATTACTSVGGTGSSLSSAASAGATTINVANTAEFKPGDAVSICDLSSDGGNPNDCGSNGELVTIASAGVSPQCIQFHCPAAAGTLTFTTPLVSNHANGSAVFDTSGNAPLPVGPTTGATPAANLGTQWGDAGISERMGEEAATLLKNNNQTLPLTAADLSASGGGVLLTGPGAQFTVADPTSEASIGYLSEDQISPLQQLEAFAPTVYGAGATNINYAPALDPTGSKVPASVLSTTNSSVTGTVNQSVNGAAAGTVSGPLDDTATNNAQLNPGSYSWSGYVNVPAADFYTFDFQQSPQVPNSSLGFWYGPTNAGATNFALGGAPSAGYEPGSPTNAGYTDSGMTTRTVSPTFNPLNVGATNTAVSTTLFAPATAGSSNIKVSSVANMAPAETLEIDTLPGATETATIASVGTAGSSTTVFAPSAYAETAQGTTYSYYNYPAGSSTLHVASTNGMSVGDQLIIDAGSLQETDTISSIGTPGSNTTLFSPTTGPLTTAAGTSNLKVTSTTGLAVGDSVVVDAPPNNETDTISSIGNPGANTTLAAATSAGATNIKLSSVTNLFAGDTLTVDLAATGLQETATIAAGGVGTAGSGGTGVNLTAPLANAHASGAAVADPGTGVNLSTPLTMAHQSGAGFSDFGSGVTLASPLSRAHLGGVAVFDNGTGVNLTAPLAHSHPYLAAVQTPQQVGYHPFTINFDTGITQLALPAGAGASNLKVVSPSFISPGEQLVLSGATNETVTVASVAVPTVTGTASICTSPSETPVSCPLSNGGVWSTSLSALAAAGASNIKVAADTGVNVGDTLIIDVGAWQETRTVTSVGTTGATGTGVGLSSALANNHISGAQVIDETVTAGDSLAAATSVGASNIKVSSTTGISAGDTLTVDSGSTNAEVVTVASVGTAGSTGTGINLNSSLAHAHAGGALVVDNTYGVTLTAPLQYNHAAGVDLSLTKTSFRLAYSRAEGDLAAAASAAASAKVAVVFLEDSGGINSLPVGGEAGVQAPAGAQGTSFSVNQGYPVSNLNLVSAVAAANPNTVVVTNNINPTLMPFINSVQSVLEMWYSGEEGGTAAARTLLGLNDPAGHVPETWAANPTDTFWDYNQTAGSPNSGLVNALLPGDTLDSLGAHPERLNGGNASGSEPSLESNGIFSDYRYFDAEGIKALFPFGWGESYTTFGYSAINATTLAPPAGSSNSGSGECQTGNSGGVAVTFTVTNTGSVAGATVAQVYVTPPGGFTTSTDAENLENGVTSAGGDHIEFPVRQLAGFVRTNSLAPGASQSITIDVSNRSLSYWSPTCQTWQDPGGYTFWVGGGDQLDQFANNGTDIPGSGPLGDPNNLAQNTGDGLVGSHNASATPTTEATWSPVKLNGYFNVDPTLTLTATDVAGPGLANSYYQVTPDPNGVPGTPGPVQTYSANPTQLNMADGEYIVSYWSTDTLGNVEAPSNQVILVDTTPPVTTVAVSPASPENGSATVSVTSATDNLSGVASTSCSVNGATAFTYTGPFQVTRGGVNTVTCLSTDVAGNIEKPSAGNTVTFQVNPQSTVGVSGNVQSTLALSIGSTTPNLGAFTPGTAQAYNATVGATATSTASTAALSAADTSSTCPGYLVNTAASGGPYCLNQPGTGQGLMVNASDTSGTSTGGGTYWNLATTNPATLLSLTAPVSNDSVTIGFRENIASTTPLRTGNYTKTITFTLSTTTP